ncbi:MAG: Mrp/NBP35 family ATP-binding protein [Lachnospiraceae bacterium]|nr:Mrp/NBP35 family ATP-binding protein [Lachnospiraceae bacterium]
MAGNTSGTDAARSRINPDFVIEDNPHSHIKHVIGVVSGKGGVGKSFVTASIANMMRAKGHPTGIMDADITGPSIPKMYGLHGEVIGNEFGSFPMSTDNDVEVMSMNVLLDTEETPVIWRGPVIAGVVKQFWTDVQWGDLDYLFVDMPPGTGDVPLTAFQSLPLDGIVIVTSPQELVSLIVKKAYNMAQMMGIPVLGVVENYSYMSCPHCGEKINVFGESSIDAVAAELDIPVLGKLPMDPTYAQNADNGVCYLSEIPALSPAEAVLEAL